MGLDLYIEARIREKKTRRIISVSSGDEYVYEDDIGFFEICWWCSWIFEDIRAKMIEICNRHAGTHYSDSDNVIPIPQSALRDIYAYLVNRSFLPDDECLEVLPCNIEWEERNSYEIMNLQNAEKLHFVLYVLKSTEFANYIPVDYHSGKKYIPIENDLKLFGENPQAYEWEFRIENSY